MYREPLLEVIRLYGVGDLALALKATHGYVTPLLNRGVFQHTHRWGKCRLFTQGRMDEIVREHGSLTRAESFFSNKLLANTSDLHLQAESMPDEA